MDPKERKKQARRILGMPMDSAQRKLRRVVMWELASSLCGGSLECARCGERILRWEDLSLGHRVDWIDDPALYWDVGNILFVHTSCPPSQQEKHAMQFTTLDIEITDHRGHRLPSVKHNGQWYVAAEDGQAFKIRIHAKNTLRRTCAVVTVDGKNVLNGEEGRVMGRGYVFQPDETGHIDGWRENLDTAAQFKFTCKDKSYAAQMGTPENVGVLGFAVFLEEEMKTAGTRVDLPQNDHPWSRRMTQPRLRSRSKGLTLSDSAQELGVGYGQSISSRITETTFRRGSSPAEIIEIRYDSRENLAKQGIIFDTPPLRKAFPGDGVGVPPPPTRV